jgi:hypothetical protein
VNLLRRKATADTADVTAEPVESDRPANAKKGRPTPKRRTTSVPLPPAPKTRKEALAWQKQQGTKTKVAGQKKMTTAEYREAMKNGDPRVLPKRDAGPVRALARDYVDSRRMASNFLLLLFPLMLIGYAIRPLQLVTLALFLMLLVEWIITGTRIRKLAIARGLQTKESAVSLGFYAGSRAYFPRSWRRPTPRLKVGDTL